jgi:hypothetical protein
MMVTQEHIDAAVARLVKLGPEGVVDTPEELCAIIGVDYFALVKASSISARGSLELMMKDIESDGGISPFALAHNFATEHMLGFLMGVLAQHMASEST